MTEPAPWPPDRPGRRPASSWIILTLSVLITLVMVISLLIRYLATEEPEQSPPAEVISPSTGGVVNVNWATDPVNTDTLDPVAVVVTELQEFWSGPAGQGLGPAVPGILGPVTAIDPGAGTFADGAPDCVAVPGQAAGNAYFCPQDQGLLFDNTALVPLLLDHYGEPGLIAALAHEYGHYVQSVVGPTTADRQADPVAFPALLIELQADCYAGVFLQHTMGGAGRLSLTPDDLPAALAPLVEFHDPADLDPADPTAHGSAMDRLRAALLGYTTGARTCRDLSLAAFGPVLGRSAAAASTTPRWPDLSAVREDTARSVEAFADAEDLIAPTVPATTDPSSYGQFGAATLLVLDTWPAAGVCLTGAWVAAATSTPVVDGLGAWISDQDEAALAVLQRAESTPLDLTAFVRGHDDGAASCNAG